MPKFYGTIGYGETREVRPGVWKDDVVEYTYFGDVVRNNRQLREGDQLNDDISVQNSISIVADAYANGHFFNMKYIEWMGARWKISEVTVEPPRLILRLGGVYNGPVASSSAT